MSSGLDIVRGGTAASNGESQLDALRMACAIVPMGFALVGGLTGASASAYPSEVIDWTSADVIEFARPTLWEDAGRTDVIEIAAYPAVSSVKRQLDAIKRKSQLTWGQVAEAMGVDARAIHLWRSGGGITASHDERLRALSALIDSIDTGTPFEVRADLLEVAPQGSLLERLRAGESPSELRASAPWRSRAVEDLQRNFSERESDGVLDEDFVFLLYLEPEEAAAFATQASELLRTPATVRADWEALLDAQFVGMQQPEVMEVEVAKDDDLADDDFDDLGIAPLFKPDDLGVSLGVGAIASRRPLHEGR